MLGKLRPQRHEFVTRVFLWLREAVVGEDAHLVHVSAQPRDSEDVVQLDRVVGHLQRTATSFTTLQNTNTFFSGFHGDHSLTNVLWNLLRKRTLLLTW